MHNELSNWLANHSQQLACYVDTAHWSAWAELSNLYCNRAAMIVECTSCGGNGGEPGANFGDYGWHPCFRCGGTGYINGTYMNIFCENCGLTYCGEECYNVPTGVEQPAPCPVCGAKEFPCVNGHDNDNGELDEYLDDELPF
jgi:hypothetical protein